MHATVSTWGMLIRTSVRSHLPSPYAIVSEWAPENVIEILKLFFRQLENVDGTTFLNQTKFLVGDHILTKQFQNWV